MTLNVSISEITYHACTILLGSNQPTKFEVTSFTSPIPKITGGQFLNGSRDPNHAPFRGGL